MLKFENISALDMLRAYMANHYPNQDALVVDVEDLEYPRQLEHLWEDLSRFNLPLTREITTTGYIILTLNQTAGISLCNKYKKAFFRMFVFHGGEMLHEN